MKQYQYSDPLHGHGKATPKLKAPNSRPIYSDNVHSIRIGAIGKCCVNGCKSSR